MYFFQKPVLALKSVGLGSPSIWDISTGYLYTWLSQSTDKQLRFDCNRMVLARCSLPKYQFSAFGSSVGGTREAGGTVTENLYRIGANNRTRKHTVACCTVHKVNPRFEQRRGYIDR